jgi:hypothetical protein
MRVVAVGGPLLLIPSPSPVGVQGVMCVANGTDTLVYRDHEALPVITWRLVDGYILVVSPRGCVLASVELTFSGHRALCLLYCRTLEQHVDLALGLAVFGCHGLW